jgi:hypothetical protein
MIGNAGCYEREQLHATRYSSPSSLVQNTKNLEYTGILIRLVESGKRELMNISTEPLMGVSAAQLSISL